MVKPNKKRIRKLVAALRSGKYRQTRGRLKGKRGYCCLGVACEISKLGEFDEVGSYVTGLSWRDCSTETLPDSVIEYYGFVNSCPVLKTRTGKESDAVSMNDGGHNNFYDIADAFERTYLD